MKIPWKKVFYFVFLLGSMFGLKNAVGQNDTLNINNAHEEQDVKGKFSISGKILEKDRKTPIPFSSIIIINQTTNKQIGGTISNIEGLFEIDSIAKGTYTLHVSFVGFKPSKIVNIILEKNTVLDVILEPSSNIVTCYVIIEWYKIPLIDPKNTTTGETIGSDDIKNMPIRR